VVSTAPRPLCPRERPCTNCTGGWVGYKTGLDVWEKSRPHRDFFYLIQGASTYKQRKIIPCYITILPSSRCPRPPRGIFSIPLTDHATITATTLLFNTAKKNKTVKSTDYQSDVSVVLHSPLHVKNA
jgi:hypothetical protein